MFPAVLAINEDAIKFILFVVIAVIVGVIKLIGFVLKSAKENNERGQQQKQRGPGQKRRNVPTGDDLWEVQKPVRPAAPPPVPKQAHRKAAPSVPQLSSEAAQAVQRMEALENGFEATQDQAYDLEASDVPNPEHAYRARKRSRRNLPKLRSKKALQLAVVSKEILDRPRCFDI